MLFIVSIYSCSSNKINNTGVNSGQLKISVPENQRSKDTIPTDFVILNDTLANAVFDIRYHGENNFVGTQVNGYLEPLCILQKEAAMALAKASKAAEEKGYRLKIFDCYRPQRAVSNFVKWASDLQDLSTKQQYYPNLPKDTLLGPYIAEKSGHSRGSSIDLTLQKLNEDGRYITLDMGTEFDFFDSLSNTYNQNLAPGILNNRRKLIAFMELGGFVNYKMEWWHFSLPDPHYKTTYFDFPVKR